MKKTWIITTLLCMVWLSACTAEAKLPTDAVTPTQAQHIPTTTGGEAADSEQEPLVTSTPTVSPETVPTATEAHATKPTQEVTSPPAETVPKQTEPPETAPPEIVPPETEPQQTVPPATEPVETLPPETTTPETVPEETAPPESETESFESSYEYKRQVAAYAAQYLNQYRSEAGAQSCTVLPGMTLVAEYRADQLCYNYSHSTADKRAALAYYEYGRWIDATVAGLDESDSYYESDTSEAICRGFRGSDARALGEAIAKLIRSSGGHWAYVGSSEYSYIGIGVEYRDDEYGWYACVMVGTVDYG